MKRLAILVALIVSVISTPFLAKSTSKNETIEHLVGAVALAFEAKTLGSLDAVHPYVGKVKIVIEHSLGENDFDTKWVKSFAQAETWLKSREINEFPSRQSRPLLKCAKGVCTFNFDGGILHNHLYLKKITYGLRSGRPYIKTIWLLDGD